MLCLRSLVGSSFIWFCYLHHFRPAPCSWPTCPCSWTTCFPMQLPEVAWSVPKVVSWQSGAAWHPCGYPASSNICTLSWSPVWCYWLSEHAEPSSSQPWCCLIPRQLFSGSDWKLSPLCALRLAQKQGPSSSGCHLVPLAELGFHHDTVDRVMDVACFSCLPGGKHPAVRSWLLCFLLCCASVLALVPGMGKMSCGLINF